MRIKLEKNEQLSCDLPEKLCRGLTGWFTRGVAWKLSWKLYDNFIGSYEDKVITGR